jgi:hypothetical protein
MNIPHAHVVLLTRLHRLLEEIDEDTMKAIWNGFGKSPQIICDKYHDATSF